jgi:FKBP-type peptidyl-prolyl cis-trans isomerase
MRTKTPIAVCIALVVAACGGSDSGTGPSTGGTLQIEDITVGTGATAVAGDTLTVHYTGTFTNGQQFDSSVGRSPFTFRLGVGGVIAGWDQGLVGMRVGGRRRLIIPPSLGYGSQGSGPIPGNSTLVFVVDLISIAGK